MHEIFSICSQLLKAERTRLKRHMRNKYKRYPLHFLSDDKIKFINFIKGENYIMPKIIIYGNKQSKDKIQNLLKHTDIEIIQPQGTSKYQQERAFVYGNRSYGHAVAIIYISGEKPIPFGVISADINKKKLPIVVYVEDNEKARKVYEDFSEFLSSTHLSINKQFGKRIDSFRFDEANYRVLFESNSIKLTEAIDETYKIYINQSESNRTVRAEASVPSDDKVQEKRNFFSKKDGFLEMANSLDAFKSQLDKNKLTVSFFGALYPPSTNVSEWGDELENCNLIYGLTGFENNKKFHEQSMMYQFAYYAHKRGANIFGTIPYEQALLGESSDFSALKINSFYITPQLQERMEAFKLSNLFIVGSTGTGTYEEVFTILDEEEKLKERYFIIINEDGFNKSLIALLEKYQNKYSNILVATNREEFKAAICTVRQKFKQANTEELIDGYFSNSFNFYQLPQKEDQDIKVLNPKNTSNYHL